MRGKNAEAEPAFRESLALREKMLASGSKDVAAAVVALTMNGLGVHLASRGRWREAEERIRASLEIRRRAGSRGYAYALSLLDLGRVVGHQKRWAEAEALDREGLAALGNFVEPDDHRLQEARAQLAEVLHAQSFPSD